MTKTQHQIRAALLSIVMLQAGSMGWAQNSSLYRQELPVAEPPLTLEGSSWLYQAAEPFRVVKLHDIVTVIVDEKSQVISEANVQRRKQAQLDAELKDWIKLDGLNIKAAPQASGDPQVNGTLQGQFRAQSNLQTADGMKFRIAARVVDIRPNGHLVLEGHRSLRNNDEQWDFSLSGIARPEDLLSNNTVLSEDLAELTIRKRERGHVRDGYRRGWLYLFLDKYGMF